MTMTRGLAALREKTVHEIWTALDGLARARILLRGTKLGARVRCYGGVLVEGRSGVEIGDRVAFLKGMLPTELRCARGAEIVIGRQTMFNYGVSIVSQRSVRIGARCRFGSLVQIRDDDGRRTEPIVIGDDVWVAHGALLEPGASVGDGSVVAAGAVLSTALPPRMLALGNPARTFPLESTSAEAVTGEPSSGRQSYTRLLAEPSRSLLPTDGRHDAPGTYGANSNASPRGSNAPARDDVRRQIIDWLDDTRLFGDAATLITSDDLSLRDAGILDSLGLVDLVLMLEERFGIVINRQSVARPENQRLSHFLDLVTMAGPRPLVVSR